MIYYNVLIEETGESFRCSPSESLLVGMERLGKKGILWTSEINEWGNAGYLVGLAGMRWD